MFRKLKLFLDFLAVITSAQTEDNKQARPERESKE